MKYEDVGKVERKIAALLAEHEATVNDLPEIFHSVRGNLTVSVRPPK